MIGRGGLPGGGATGNPERRTENLVSFRHTKDEARSGDKKGEDNNLAGVRRRGPPTPSRSGGAVGGIVFGGKHTKFGPGLFGLGPVGSDKGFTHGGHERERTTRASSVYGEGEGLGRYITVGCGRDGVQKKDKRVAKERSGSNHN